MEPRLYRHSPTVGPIVPSTLGEVLVMVALRNRADHADHYTLRVNKKQATIILPITSPNVDRFSKFFH